MTGAGTMTICLTSVEVMVGSAVATVGSVVTVGLVVTSLVVGGDNGNLIVFCVSIPFLFTPNQQSFSYKGKGLPGLNQYLARINVLAQGHNAVTPTRLEPAAPRSPVKHSTTEPPFYLFNRIEHWLSGMVNDPEQDTLSSARYWFNPGRPTSTLLKRCRPEGKKEKKKKKKKSSLHYS